MHVTFNENKTVKNAFEFQKHMDQSQEDRQKRLQVVDFGHRTRRHLGLREVHVSSIGPFVPTVSIGCVDRASSAGSHNETVRHG